MANEQDNLEKSQEPTPKRQEEARKKGQVVRARALIPSVGLLGATAVLSFAGETLMVTMSRFFTGFLTLAGEQRDLSASELVAFASHSGWLLLPVLAPLFAGVVLAGVSGGIVQTGGLLWTTDPLRPDFSRINPLSGFRRLLGLDGVLELGKALIQLLCLGTLGFLCLRANLNALTALPTLAVGDILRYGSHEGAWLLRAGVLIMVVLAALDYFLQRWRHRSQLRMSMQEVKEEMREQEGDPMLKGRLKSLRQRMARQRMMEAVPKADVVITNPTHLAVALRYNMSEMTAPQVVAKGAGFVAQRIREIARTHGVPLLENKPLAQLLYKQVEIGQEVPESLYRAVAEVLAYVFRLRQQRAVGAKG